MRGLRGRLTLGVTTVLAVVLVVAGVVVAREVDRSERQGLDDRLRRTAELSRATAVTAVQQGLPDADHREHRRDAEGQPSAEPAHRQWFLGA